MRWRISWVGLTLALVILAAAPAKARQYAAIVVDYGTGEVLHARHADTPIYPASLTKMMTLYMLFEAIERGDLDHSSKLAVSRRAAGMPASKLGLSQGSTITVENAILALTTRSANDVAVVVAEALGGSEIKFARMMTERAREIGMAKTTFMNASGLPNRDQKSTVRDMARLSARLLREHRVYYPYFANEVFTYRGRTYRSHNRLMKRYRGMDGLKTGYIRASGFNLAASAERNGRRVIVVVVGGRTAESRDKEVARLLDLGFERLLERDGPVHVAGPPMPKPADAITVAALPAPEPRPESRAMPETAARPETVTADSAATEAVTEAAATGAALTETASAATQVAAVEAAGESVVDAAEPLPTVEPRPVVEVDRAPATAAAVAEDDTAAVVDADVPIPAAKPELRLAAGPEKQKATGRYGVQVGAYHDPNQARHAAYGAASRVPDILLAGDVAISALEGRRRPVYRARLIGLSRQDADEACRRLHRDAHDCLVIQVESLQLAENRG